MRDATNNHKHDENSQRCLTNDGKADNDDNVGDLDDAPAAENKSGRQKGKYVRGHEHLAQTAAAARRKKRVDSSRSPADAQCLGGNQPPAVCADPAWLLGHANAGRIRLLWCLNAGAHLGGCIRDLFRASDLRYTLQQSRQQEIVERHIALPQQQRQCGRNGKDGACATIISIHPALTSRGKNTFTTSFMHVDLMACVINTMLYSSS